MRLLVLLTILMAVFGGIFEAIYLYSLKEIGKSSRGEKEKIAKDIELSLFENKKLEWKFYGKVMDLSNSKKIILKDFKAEKIGKHLKISANEAVFYPNEKKIYLDGNVNLNSLRKGKKLSIRVPEAVVDLKSKIVKGYGLFEGKEGDKILKGKGFIYTLDGKVFKIEKNARTSINPN